MAVTSFEATNSNFLKNDENNSFSPSTPRQWYPDGRGETTDRLNELLRVTTKHDVELHVKEVTKRGTRVEIENSGYKLSGIDDFGSE